MPIVIDARIPKTHGGRIMIGKLQRVPLREIWRSEARDFTTWLQDNIDVLNDAIDRNLSNPEREQSAGSFNVDLVAEDESGNPVIIENQLEKSNHDHLGKIITYLTMLDAKAAVWIVADPRPEHIGAISWLNESSAASFYLLKLEGVRIGDSDPAPLLTLIVGPSEEAQDIGRTKKELGERQSLRYRFWEALLAKAENKTTLHAKRGANTSNWIAAGAGKSGISYNYVITQHESRVELCINRGKNSGEENKRLFDLLLVKKQQIEEAFGGKLIWNSAEGVQMCRIQFDITGGGYSDEDDWPRIHDELIDVMISLERALRPHIAKLPV